VADGDYMQVGYQHESQAVTRMTATGTQWEAGLNVRAPSMTGVIGSSDSRPGVWGGSQSHQGVYGTTRSGNGVFGSSGTGSGVYGTSDQGYAGYFNGNVRVTGVLNKGGGGFKIDHPLDPENKDLNHSFVESPDMKNIYDGAVQLDEEGTAWVELPEWFEELNRSFRYHLTAIGAPAPELHIAEEVSENRFKIAGGEKGTKVCWQVTGIRKDGWAEANRIVVEEDKDEQEQERLQWAEVAEVAEVAATVPLAASAAAIPSTPSTVVPPLSGAVPSTPSAVFPLPSGAVPPIPTMPNG